MTTTSSSTTLRSREPRMKGLLRANSQRGVTLIEVLVTLLVLSIGLVGIALLHLNSLKFTHSSYYTSVASSVALDLEERLWVALGTRAGGCLDSADVDVVIGDIRNLWPDAGASRVGIPGMTVTRGTISDTATYMEVPITLSWTDARFTDGNSFPFAARVVCFEPPAVPEEEG
jgi:type IV pilus assembly protein PilV